MATIGITWQNVPLEALVHIFRYLSPNEISRCARVCKQWQGGASAPELWRQACKEDFVIESKADSATYREIYVDMHCKWKKYLPVYNKVRSVWQRLETWLQSHAPAVFASLNPGASEEQCDALEKSIDCSLDLATRCSLRIHNGQNAKVGMKRGLLGGYKFYDFRADLVLTDINTMLTLRTRVPRTAGWASVYCLAVAMSGYKNYFMVVKEAAEFTAQRGAIIEHDQIWRNPYFVAPSYIGMLETLADSVETGNYELSKKSGQIIRYPLKDGVSVEVTRGIRVTVSPLFVPERSYTTNQGTYLFAYRIRMEVDKNEPLWTKKCRLQSRHWVITDATGKVEEVDGPGVIGKYPEMYPGAFFQYSSCCPIATPNGSMKGTFTMQYEDSSLFDVIVPEYYFKASPSVMR